MRMVFHKSSKCNLLCACLITSRISRMYVFTPDQSFHIIRRKTTLKPPKLTLPPIIRTLRLLQHPNPIPLTKRQIPVPLPGEIIQRRNKQSSRLGLWGWRGSLLFACGRGCGCNGGGLGRIDIWRADCAGIAGDAGRVGWLSAAVRRGEVVCLSWAGGGEA